MHRLAALLALAPAVAAGATLDYSAFRTPAQVDAAMSTLAASYPSLVRIVPLGTTLGGLPIRALKISTTPDVDDPAKGDAVFVALHHAREWITVETALYVADELLARRATDPALAAELARLQVWVIPVLNPDGYAHTRSGDRLWRKNRRPNGDGSFGVDPNRNYGFQFGLSGFDPVDGRHIAVSTMPASPEYIGPSGFSERETQTLRDFLLARQNLRFVVSYHSYHGLWLRPWSYTGAEPPGELFLKAISDRSRALIQAVHAVSFADDISYHSAGEATDWIWNTLRTAAFTPEVRPRACLLDPDPACTVPPGHSGGFAPAETHILPNNQEQFPAARALIHDAARTGLWIKDHPDDDGSEPSARPTPGGGWSRAFWESPDIWTDPVDLRGGETVRLFVRVRNETGVSQSGVQVRAYYTDPRIALEFPSPTSTEIGSTSVTVPPAGSVVEFPWTIPNTLNSWGEPHWCVGVVIVHQDDMPLSSQIQKTSNIGGRNFQTVLSPLTTASLVLVAADNNLGTAAELIVEPDPELKRLGWRVEPVLPEWTKRMSPGTRRKASLLDVKGHVLEPGQSLVLPVRILPPPGTLPGTEMSVRLNGLLRPLIAGARPTLGNGFTYRVRVADH